jgi:hypothetical protein
MGEMSLPKDRDTLKAMAEEIRAHLAYFSEVLRVAQIRDEAKRIEHQALAGEIDIRGQGEELKRLRDASERWLLKQIPGAPPLVLGSRFISLQSVVSPRVLDLVVTRGMGAAIREMQQPVWKLLDDVLAALAELDSPPKPNQKALPGSRRKRPDQLRKEQRIAETAEMYLRNGGNRQQIANTLNVTLKSVSEYIAAARQSGLLPEEPDVTGN